MKEGILTVDFGTTNVRVNMINPVNGDMLYSVSMRNHINTTDRGYAELNPEELWENAVLCMEKMVSKVKENKIHIATLGFSFFGDNLILCDKDYSPVSPLILSFDTRGKEQIQRFLDSIGYETIIRKVGSVPDWSSVPAKYMWLREKAPMLIENTSYCFSCQQYVLSRLGLDPVNDTTMAFRKSLLNMDSVSWDEDLTAYLGVSDKMLGRIVDSGEILGRIRKFGNVEFPYEIPVIAGAHDCSLGFAGLGLSSTTDKLMGNITGTFDHFGFFQSTRIMNERFLKQRKNEILMGCGCLKDSWIVMGAIPAYGTFLEWLVNLLFRDGGQDTYRNLWKAVSLDGTQSVSVYPVSTVEKGYIEGLEFSSTAVDIFEAAVEALTFRSREVMELCCNYKAVYPEEIRIGGGTSRADKWNQLRADVMGIPFTCTENVEASSMGAAILCAVSCGIYPDTDIAIKEMVHITKTFVPNIENSKYYEKNMRIIC